MVAQNTIGTFGVKQVILFVICLHHYNSIIEVFGIKGSVADPYFMYPRVRISILKVGWIWHYRHIIFFISTSVHRLFL